MESTFGCTEFDSINPSSGCAHALDWFVNPNWSPWDIQYTGPASGGKPVTFDTWNQYAEWRTSVAAGAPDPCVFANFNNGTYTGSYSVNTTMSQSTCNSTSGGQWVPPGINYTVNSQGIVVQQQGSWWTTPSLSRGIVKGAAESGLEGGVGGCVSGMIAGGGPFLPTGWVGCGVVGLPALAVGVAWGAASGAYDWFFP